MTDFISLILEENRTEKWHKEVLIVENAGID